MKHLTVLLSDIERIDYLKTKLQNDKELDQDDKCWLLKLLNEFPPLEHLMMQRFPMDETMEVKLYDMTDNELQQWKKLFFNIPGEGKFCGAGFTDSQTEDRKEYQYLNGYQLRDRNVLIEAEFAPSMGYTRQDPEKNIPFRIHLIDDGTAYFLLPTVAEAKRFPDLYRFKGTWKEAYLLMIETMKKGWPQEEFPEELLPFISNKE